MEGILSLLMLFLSPWSYSINTVWFHGYILIVNRHCISAKSKYLIYDILCINLYKSINTTVPLINSISFVNILTSAI